MNDRSRLQTALTVLLTLVFVIGALAPCNAYGAEAKPGWQVEWEKTLGAAKKEGQVAVYISGYEEILPEFQKEYPEIKVLLTTGRGSQSISINSAASSARYRLSATTKAIGSPT